MARRILDGGGRILTLPPLTAIPLPHSGTHRPAGTDPLAFAATIVVNQDGTGDATTIAAGIALLPAAGGTVYVEQGTYVITTTIALPAKPVRIVGTERGATILSIGSNAIAVFTIASNHFFSFSNFELAGDGTVGQRILDVTSTDPEAAANFGRILFDKIAVASATPIEKVVKVTGGVPNIEFRECRFKVPDTAGALFWDGTGFISAWSVICNNDVTAGRGGFLGSPSLVAFKSTFGVQNGGAFGNLFGVCSGFIGPVAMTSGNTRLFDCNFATSTSLTISTNGSHLTVCRWFGTLPAFCVSLLAGADECTIQGSRFQFSGTEAIKVASTGNVITGNDGAKVTESGVADDNRYSNNTGFGGSTIIGDQSLVENENFRNVKTWGATGDGVTDDTAAIQAAINAVPTRGGVVYFPEGIYDISMTLSLPTDRPIRIIGSGRRSTVIDIGANAIAVFTIASGEHTRSFSDFGMAGNNAAVGQVMWSIGSGPATASQIFMDRVYGDAFGKGLEKVVDITGGALPSIAFTNCRFSLSNLVGARLWTGSGGDLRMVNTRCVVNSAASNLGGGISGNPNVNILNCVIGIRADCSVGVNSYFLNCDLKRGTVTVNGDDTTLISCRLESNSVARRVDIPAGSDRTRIIGCFFTAGTSETLRTAGTEGYFSGNEDFKVLETGAADKNRYSDNEGFDGSTIIGPDSVVDDANTRTITTTPVTLDRDDRTVLVDASGGTRLLNLPTAASARYHKYTIKKTDSSGNAVTVDASGAETIDGALTQVLMTQFASIEIQSDGTKWDIISSVDNAVAEFPPGYVNGARLVFSSVTTINCGVAGLTTTLRDSTNTLDISFSGVISAIITSAGAGGLDTGAEAASTWYAVHVIGDSTGVNAPALMFSLSATAPTLPSGYDTFRRVGWERNNASSNFLKFNQRGSGKNRRYVYDETRATVQVLTSGSATTWTTISLASFMPPTSELSILSCSVEQSSSAVGSQLRLRRTGDTVSEANAIIRLAESADDFGAGSEANWASVEVETNGSQQIDYAQNAAGDDADIYLQGFIDEI